ncbi:MAG: shikimate dehydrogenase [Candidatus Omnitrophica bacterium]|nr:shikimate dehydrogenase [Candidatus Omnitrophota bacterium]
MEMTQRLKLYGIFGYPLRHTLSPAMHNRAFRLLGLNAVYLALELNPRQFRSLFYKKRNLILDGFNVTIPYKEEAFRYCDHLSLPAHAVGAVNTVKLIKGRLFGYNTDIDGFEASLKKARYSLKNKRVLLFGAGGAARAVTYASLKQGARSIRIVEVDLKRARSLKRDFRRIFAAKKIEITPYKRCLIKSALRDTDCIINASGVGLRPKDPSLIEARDFAGLKNIFVYDLIYNPPVTPLLRAARRKGFKVLNGLDMLLFQGAKAFEIWTGRRPPVAEMLKTLKMSKTLKRS